MQAVVFCGLQGAGKSSFYATRFARTHVRINLDMLKTRNREDILLHACLAAQQPFVVDNTNPTPEQRKRYIGIARASGFDVIGYYFDTAFDICVQRNAQRAPIERVPEIAIHGTHTKFVPPTIEEGYSSLAQVRLMQDGSVVEEVIR